MDNAKRKGRPPKNSEAIYIRGKYTPASGILSNEYNKKTYFTVRLKKKEKSLISAAAKKSGLSLNSFVEDSVRRRIYEVLTDEERANASQSDEDTTSE